MNTGFFGKIPATGDFVAWNLPRTFIDRWDRWMSMELRARPDEGELDSRCWRFTVPEGIFSDQPCAGAWRMSEDRAGRRYPFVIAMVGGTPRAADPWFDSVCAVVRAAVVDFWTTPELIENLSRLKKIAELDPTPEISFWSIDWEVQEVKFANIYDLAEQALPIMRAERPTSEVS